MDPHSVESLGFRGFGLGTRKILLTYSGKADVATTVIHMRYTEVSTRQTLLAAHNTDSSLPHLCRRV